MRVIKPDPDALLQAIAGRIDTFEARLDRLDRDVTALGRGMAGVTSALHDLTTDLTASPDADDADGAAVLTVETPTCWVEVSDPNDAVAWLLDLAAWVTACWHAVTDTHHLAGCWPWHPRAVTELLALKAAHAAAYAAGPLVVVDLEHRHLPDGLDVLDHVLAACVRAGTHVNAAGVPYLQSLTGPGGAEAAGQPNNDVLIDLAVWWATDRTGDAPGQISPAAVAHGRRS